MRLVQHSAFGWLVAALAISLAACAPGENNGATQRTETRMTEGVTAHNTQQQRFVLVLLGDSLTQGYGLPRGRSLTAQLQQLLDAQGAHVDLRNAGVSGETSAQGLARFDRAPADADGVVIQLGANDMLQGRSPGAVRTDLSALIGRAQERELWVGLVGMKAPPIAGAAYRAAFDRIYPELAEEHGVPLYPFYFEGLIDVQTGAIQPDLFLRDRVHPSEQGVGVVAQGMAAWLETTLPAEALRREAR